MCEYVMCAVFAHVCICDVCCIHTCNRTYTHARVCVCVCMSVDVQCVLYVAHEVSARVCECASVFGCDAGPVLSHYPTLPYPTLPYPTLVTHRNCVFGCVQVCTSVYVYVMYWIGTHSLQDTRH